MVVVLSKHQMTFVKKLQSLYGDGKIQEISNQKETLTIQYLSSVNLTNSVNLIDTSLTELENSRKRDLFKKRIQCRPTP